MWMFIDFGIWVGYKQSYLIKSTIWIFNENYDRILNKEECSKEVQWIFSISVLKNNLEPKFIIDHKTSQPFYSYKSFMKFTIFELQRKPSNPNLVNAKFCEIQKSFWENWTV